VLTPARQLLPDLPDLWTPVGCSNLPPSLVDAVERQDWQSVRTELSTVMDGAITDGKYGRELLQFVIALPTDVDPLFDRYRVAAMVDYGDWDGLRASSLRGPEPLEVKGLREILTAPIDQTALPNWDNYAQRRLFEIYEFEARRDEGSIRHWAQRIAGHLPESLWRREDVAIGRHLRLRQLHDAMMLAIAEAHGGRLQVAFALSTESQRLGDDGEPLRDCAHDLSELVRLAMGDDTDFEMRIPMRVAHSTGPSPLGSWEMLFYVIPFASLRADDVMAWTARLGGVIAARLASPRFELQAASWRVASELRDGKSPQLTELAGVTAKARRATPGLRGLPTFLLGFANRSYRAFEDAERLARRSGNAWLQVSSLAWMTAVDPRPSAARHLRMLLDVTGWRRPVLVPSEIAADAALGLTAMGERSESILELAITANRPNVTSEVATRYIDDPNTPEKVRRAAVDALGQVSTTHARETLAKLAQRRDEIGKTAAAVRERPSGLSEREVEVLALAAEGLTNKQIADQLFLSPHTVARHIANARGKLGAANRTEAAALLRQPSR
jgi:DNA-binding CsgD family transcriptional regulator